MYGNGLQTWEYSPLFALRSYAYIVLHWLPISLIPISFKVRLFRYRFGFSFIRKVFSLLHSMFFEFVLQLFVQHVKLSFFG